MMPTRKIYLFLIIVKLLLPETSLGQGINTVFGQNKIQYKSFEWFYYDSKNFRIYYYLGGQELAKFTVQDAENSLTTICQSLEYSIDGKIEILVYNTYHDMLQSNVALDNVTFQPGGTATIKNEKIPIYFDGSHKNLHLQIKKGTANVLVNQVINGTTLPEMILNKNLSKKPLWLEHGLVEYLTQPWSIDDDDLLKELIQSKKIKNFAALTNYDVHLAGRSLWYYIASSYGKSAIPNFVYVARINKSIENACALSLGVSYKVLLQNWYDYHQQQYDYEDNLKQTPETSNQPTLTSTRNEKIIHAALSNNGEELAYLVQKNGKYKLKTKAFLDKNSQQKLQKKGGSYSLDNYVGPGSPMFCYNSNNTMLLLLHYKKMQPFLTQINLITKEKISNALPRFNHVNSIAFGWDENTILLSANANGQSDIYTYKLNNGNIQNITNDLWDDMAPVYYKDRNSKGILFASNRWNHLLSKDKLDTILPINNYKIWMFDINNPTLKLIQLSADGANAKQPFVFDEGQWGYISDLNGIDNIYIGNSKWDSIYTHTEHKYYFDDSTVIDPKYNMDKALVENSGKIKYVTHDKKYRYIGLPKAITNFNKSVLSISMANKNESALLQLRQKDNEIYSIIYLDESSKTLENTTFSVISTNYINYNNDSLIVSKDAQNNTATYHYLPPNQLAKTSLKLNKVIPYSVQMQTKSITTQLDNTIVFNQYEPINGLGQPITNPALAGFFRSTVIDLMGDYRLTGGYRMPVTMRGGEYFINYENLKKRVDYNFLGYLKNEQLQYIDRRTGFDYLRVFKQKQILIQASGSYPFSTFVALKFHTALRWEKLILPARNYYSARFLNTHRYWLQIKPELVIDNTINPATNIWKGTRAKVYFEIFQSIKDKNSVYVLGLDLRHYKPIYKNCIWSQRLAAASSVGKSKVLYYLGGIENWINWSNNKIFDEQNTLPSIGYAYQALACNLRGFLQNTRNGNNYLIYNTDVRIPIWSSLTSIPLQNELLNNLQLVGFLDLGGAWKGTSLFKNNAPTEFATFSNIVTTVTLNYYQSPMIAGTGVGLRSSLFGYFMRLDAAWGWDQTWSSQPTIYLGFGTDF